MENDQDYRLQPDQARILRRMGWALDVTADGSFFRLLNNGKIEATYSGETRSASFAETDTSLPNITVGQFIVEVRDRLKSPEKPKKASKTAEEMAEDVHAAIIARACAQQDKDEFNKLTLRFLYKLLMNPATMVIPVDVVIDRAADFANAYLDFVTDNMDNLTDPIDGPGNPEHN